MVGRGPEEVSEARVLNIIVRATRLGWEYEADQRHADIIIRELGLEEAKSVKTPGEEEQEWRQDEDDQEVVGKEATQFRGLAARANYLSSDRADIQYATKEVCRGMAKPTKRHMRKLRRLGRYLVGCPRVVSEFGWQGRASEVKAYSDSDWAGCKRTAKSTSGGVLMLGEHCVKSWSTTQKSISLSSGEAELVAAVKASSEALGLMSMMRDWGMSVKGQVYVDSSAALGVVGRKGNGKLRHVRVGMLWVQQKEETGELQYKKVLGTDNPADLLTKYLTQSVTKRHTEKVQQRPREGRAAEALTA